MRSNSNSPLNIGIIGTNFGLKTIAPAILNNSSFRLVCVADSSPLVPEGTTTELGIPKIEVGKLIADPSLELIWIATPPSTHAVLIQQVLDAGKIVICEKPCGISLEEVSILKSLSIKNTIPIFVNFEFRYDPIYSNVFRAAKEIRNGELFQFNVSWKTARNAKKPNRDDFKSSLLDFAIHVLDCFLNFANEIQSDLLSVKAEVGSCPGCETISLNCTSIKMYFDAFSANIMICRNYSDRASHVIELISDSIIACSGIEEPFSSTNVFYGESYESTTKTIARKSLGFPSIFSDMRIHSMGLMLQNIFEHLESGENGRKPPGISDAHNVHSIIDKILRME
jgi:predicted dehydrogenase